METIKTIETDIAVIGTGPGGLAAAVEAARQGLRVTAVEKNGIPGGMASVGEVSPFMPNAAGGIELDRGIYREWRERMRNYLSPAGKEYAGKRTIHKEYAALAAEDLLLEADAEVLYNHAFIDGTTRSEGGRKNVKEIRLLSKSGIIALRARFFIDATGDGDLAARCGFAYEEGGPSGFGQPMTLCFKVSGIARDKLPDRKEISRLYDLAREAGEIDCPRENVLFFDTTDPSILHFNTTRVIKKHGTNGFDLSEGEITGRRQLREYLAFFRKRVPGMEACELHSMAATIGIRESRRILGETYITREDFVGASSFDDAVARVHYNVDIHNPNGTGTEFLRLREDQYYEIPYGCLVPKGAGNLLMGCRAISADHVIHSSLRIMPVVCSLGQAAGLAAALAVKENLSAHRVDGVGLRGLLRAEGCYL